MRFYATIARPRFRIAPFLRYHPADLMESAERRRNPRLGMVIAVRVQGFLVGGATWDEVTQTDDVSVGGASITITHPVELGQVLYLSLAMPKTLRQYDLSVATYRVYSLVRGITRRAEDSRVGLMFYGQFPPRGFQEKPWARFLLPSDNGALAAANAMSGTGSSDDTPAAPSGPSRRAPLRPSGRLNNKDRSRLRPRPIRASAAPTRASSCS